MNTLLTKLFSKDLFTKMVLTLFLVLGTSQAWGDTVTKCDSTNTNSNIPIASKYLDAQFVKSEYILLSSELTAMHNKQITQLIFYSDKASISYGEAQFRVFMEEVTTSSIPWNKDGYSFIDTNNATTVYTGSLSINSDKQMIINLTNPFIYTGSKHLLVGIECTTKGTKASSTVSFYGASNFSYYRGIVSSSSTGDPSTPERCGLRPKTTFTYVDPVSSSLSVSPDDDVDFGTVWADATLTNYYTITNNSALTVNVVASIGGTDASSFSVSPSGSQEIASGDSQTYTISYTYNPISLGGKTASITFAPDDDTDAITKSITANAVSNFTISSLDGAFGTVTDDANKIYTITNNTGATVKVTPSITGTNADMFSVSPSVETDIDDGESHDFTVTFDWEPNVTKLGEKTATITFNHNKEGYAPFVISASATAKTQVVIDEDHPESLSTGASKSVYVNYTPSNGWNTICMPIWLSSASFMNNIFGSGWKAYELTTYDNGTLTFSKNNSPSWSTPYLVYIKTATGSPFVIPSTTVYTTAAKSIANDGTTTDDAEKAIFKGSFAAVDMEGKYGLTPAGKVMKGAAGSQLKGFRAYFTNVAPPSPGARVSIVFEGDDETTDLGFVKMVDPEAKDVYTLSGQKVEKAGKGIYIVNGRKVVIK